MREFYKKVIKTFGYANQLLVFMEEMGELIQAVSKYNRFPSDVTRKQVITEIADVQIMTEQIITAFHIEEWEIYNEKFFKIDRLRELVKEKEEIKQ